MLQPHPTSGLMCNRFHVSDLARIAPQITAFKEARMQHKSRPFIPSVPAGMYPAVGGPYKGQVRPSVSYGCCQTQGFSCMPSTQKRSASMLCNIINQG